MYNTTMNKTCFITIFTAPFNTYLNSINDMLSCKCGIHGLEQGQDEITLITTNP